MAQDQREAVVGEHPEKARRRRARDPQITSRMMAAVRSRDSKAEWTLRKELNRAGVRFRLHARDVVGRPDIVIRKYRLAIFVDGDMWHGNAWRLRGLRSLEELFPNRTEWWATKIRRNMARDQEVTKNLISAGWTVVRLWESDVLADPASATRSVLDALTVARQSVLAGGNKLRRYRKSDCLS